MSIQIIKPGILTTLQDEGRVGFAQFGINRGGVMDWFSAKVLNLLLGNSTTEAVLEIHFPAASFSFLSPTRFAITGADFSPKLNFKSIEVNKSYWAKTGDILHFSAKNKGERAYFGIEGGFETPTWLASVSPNQAADFEAFSIKNDAILKAKKNDFTNKKIFVSNEFSIKKTNQIRYIPEIDLALNQDFVISPNANRMGFLLQSEPVSVPQSSILSSAVGFGTIQILPSGQLIVLMADHQTSGGYPRLGTIVLADLPNLAQMPINTPFNLTACSVETAEEAYFKQLRLMRQLEAGIGASK
jgi:antagonist of KipI